MITLPQDIWECLDAVPTLQTLESDDPRIVEILKRYQIEYNHNYSLDYVPEAIWFGVERDGQLVAVFGCQIDLNHRVVFITDIASIGGRLGKWGLAKVARFLMSLPYTHVGFVLKRNWELRDYYAVQQRLCVPFKIKDEDIIYISPYFLEKYHGRRANNYQQ